MKYIFLTLILTLTLPSFGQQSKEMFERGIVEYQKGNLLTADSLLSKAIEYDQNIGEKDPYKFYNRGVIRRDLDSIIPAIHDFDIALMLKPDFFEALDNRATCHYLWDQDSLALIDATRALTINPKSMEIYVLRIVIYIGQNELRLASVDCSKALTVKKDPRFYAFRSMIAAKSNNFKNAEKDIKLGEYYFGTNNIHLIEARVFDSYMKKNYKEMCHHYQMLSMIDNDWSFLFRKDIDFIKALDGCKN
jgi:tetratricopeptide (TPR) repeat protein